MALRVDADEPADHREHGRPRHVAERAHVDDRDHPPEEHEPERERRRREAGAEAELGGHERDRHRVEVGEQRVRVVDRDSQREGDAEQQERNADNRAPPRPAIRFARLREVVADAALGAGQFEVAQLRRRRSAEVDWTV